ncbi:hypothetical protein AGMMS49525_07860 [Bacteroidia bacterium]|nr:hypothetical protein AGMMS49525_07860 [Bacteroidia bacterium]
MKTMTFNDLRKIKDNLPTGSIQRIADDLLLPVETVKNYFGGINDNAGSGSGIHVEPGPNGGAVKLDDPTILERALIILGEETYNVTTN